MENPSRQQVEKPEKTQEYYGCHRNRVRQFNPRILLKA